MRQKSVISKKPAEKVVRDIRRQPACQLADVSRFCGVKVPRRITADSRHLRNADDPLRTVAHQIGEFVTKHWIGKRNNLIVGHGGASPHSLNIRSSKTQFQQECAAFFNSRHTPDLSVAPIKYARRSSIAGGNDWLVVAVFLPDCANVSHRIPHSRRRTEFRDSATRGAPSRNA